MGQPGAGGWPTVRIFTPETGIEGESYVKKTTRQMCEELGDETYMQGLVEEKAGITHEVRPNAKQDRKSSRPKVAAGKDL